MNPQGQIRASKRNAEQTTKLRHQKRTKTMESSRRVVEDPPTPIVNTSSYLDTPKSGKVFKGSMSRLAENKTSAAQEAASTTQASLIKEQLAKHKQEMALEHPGPLAQIRCLGCYMYGHIGKDCPTRIAFKCFKCGKSDHSARNCSITETIYTFAYCYRCKTNGHLTRACPNHGVQDFHKSQKKNYFREDCPKGMEKIVDPKATEKKGTVSDETKMLAIQSFVSVITTILQSN